MLKVENLTKTYDKRSKNANTVLHGISFTLPDTGFVCILGPSGCGKTSLLNAIGGLDRFDSGKISYDGRDLKHCGSNAMEKERNLSFGYIFQNYHLLPEHSVMYNVYIGMHSLKLSHKEKIKRAKEVLGTVGMELYSRRIVSELSGGQQQRVAIARALARRPRVILADEPTGNLDEENTVNICKLLREISKTSLVIMVTHEENIARFFADRIITLSDGRQISDKTDWKRSGLSYDSTSAVYAGEFEEEGQKSEKLELRILYEKDAPAAKLTVVVQKDRVIIKHDGSRTLTCTDNSEEPEIKEGVPPRISFSALEEDNGREVFNFSETPMTRAGSGINAAMTVREARHMMKGGGKRSALRLFLILLSVLTLFTVGDFLTVTHLDPHDFVNCDSRLLLVNVNRGLGLDSTEQNAVLDAAKELRAHISGIANDAEFIPYITSTPIYKESVFRQMADTSVLINGFSFMPTDHLDGKTVIYGRMPERSDEAVVDRWLLDKMLQKDGILQNGINDISYFIGKKLSFSHSRFSPTVVGICDSGEPSIYLSDWGICAADTKGENMIPISELNANIPQSLGKFSVEGAECIVIEANAGAIWGKRIGRYYDATAEAAFLIKGSYPYATDMTASIAVNDGMEKRVLESLLGRKFYVICGDKEAMKQLLEELPPELANKIDLTVTDRAGEAWNEQRSLARERMGARMIVTVTVVAVCAVMLWLLQRSRVRAHSGMIAVYRLLCIPKRKLVSVFFWEACLSSLTSALPATVLAFFAMRGASMVAELNYSVYLPVAAAAITYGCILLFHLAASVLPVLSLVRIPPARLAAKYDF